MNQQIYDLIAIGAGPFNLGLAALSAGIPNFTTAFFDKVTEFNWHPGLMIEGARLQVPWYADLVTLPDPTNCFSYLNYLKSKGGLFRFGIAEPHFLTRKEFNNYCQWVAANLPNVHFGHRCESVSYDDHSQTYEVHLQPTGSPTTVSYRARHLVIGIGTEPQVPPFAKPHLSKTLFHSADYLYRKPSLLNRPRDITLVGSGQSAAEIFYDLLQTPDHFRSLHWLTRADRFYPMDYTKLTLEMTSPDYIDYFHSLSSAQKRHTLARQDMLYKGINQDLIGEIYDRLYALAGEGPLSHIRLYTESVLQDITRKAKGPWNLQFRHRTTRKRFTRESDAVILATGYRPTVPAFLEPVRHLIRWTKERLYDVQRGYRIDDQATLFVQNADLHSHGFNSADLCMGPYRNAVILNKILGREVYKVEKGVGFQVFGPDGR